MLFHNQCRKKTNLLQKHYFAGKYVQRIMRLLDV